MKGDIVDPTSEVRTAMFILSAVD